MKEHNADNHLDCLLRKYHEGSVNVEEFKKLLKQLDTSDDEEIREQLQSQWEQFDSPEEIPESKITALYDAISKKTGKRQSLLLNKRAVRFIHEEGLPDANSAEGI